MKLRSWGAAALAACVLAAGGAGVQAKQAVPTLADEAEPGAMAAEMDSMEQSELGSYGACNSCDSCSVGGGGFGGLLSRPIQLIVGAEYIYAKANFSDALAYVEQQAGEGEIWHCFDYEYNSSYSVYGGVYLPDCGGALIFDYTRLTSDANVAAQNSTGVDIFGPFEIDDNITGSSDVDLKSYDLSFAKTIPLGCALECGGKGCGDCCDDACATGGCGDGCGDGCGCGWCPAWDITWSAGLRFADVSWTRGLANAVAMDSYQTTMTFDNGFGGRVGLMGRRYIGRRGLFSLYGKGDWSVLLGDVELETIVTTGSNTAFHRKNCEQVIPVTEIELGGSVHLGSHATLSAGYFWAAWHDLGMSETYDFDMFQVSHYDDANILGFDGLFARVELAF